MAFLRCSDKMWPHTVIARSIKPQKMFNSASALPTGSTLAAENCYTASKHVSHSCNKFCDACWSSLPWLLELHYGYCLQRPWNTNAFSVTKTGRMMSDFMIIRTVYAFINIVISSSVNIQAAIKKKVFHILFFPVPCCEFILSHVGVKSCHKIKYSTLVVPSMADTLIHKSYP